MPDLFLKIDAAAGRKRSLLVLLPACGEKVAGRPDEGQLINYRLP